ncbi:tetratricopeptide repeat protein [Tabrizicola sp. WMC-M-20]|nr:tetratricopeptide repeat protein [Tabrizicola sp. WMC-M-20]
MSPRPLCPRLVIVGLLVGTLVLSGCQSAEEKAEDHYRSALTLLEAGDQDRAMVELRNVFQLDGLHKEARHTYATILLERGENAEANGQLLRLVEQYPDTLDARQKLAELALLRGDLAEFQRHGEAAVSLNPAPVASQAIASALAYRAAAEADDPSARAAAVTLARAVLEEAPDNQIAQRIVIDSQITSDTPEAALPEIDKLLAREPNNLEFHMLKFRLLVQQEDGDVIGAQLREMQARFPQDETVRQWLLSWYLSSGDIDGAETFLRDLAGDPTGPPDGHVVVVQMLQATRGDAAARAELKRLAEANAGQEAAGLWRALGAVIDFNAGQRREAMVEMEDILKDAPETQQTLRIKVMMAQLLQADGNPVGARARVEEILASDLGNVEALKMRAAWYIAEDKPGEAIVDLRAALGQAPRDTEVLTLMSQAHDREGARDLAGERLALAVEISGNAPQESIRYARFLLRDSRLNVAESVLTAARRASPRDVGVLNLLGEVTLAMGSPDRAEEVIATLEALPGEPAADAAQKLRTALVLSRGQNEESLALLQEMIANGDTDARTLAMLIDTQLRAGKPEDARRVIEEQLAANPDSAELRIMRATLSGLLGQPEAAEEDYRTLIAANPGAENPVRLYYGLLTGTGRRDEAEALLRTARAANPGSLMVGWLLAGHIEQDGDIDATIAIYEELYAANSDNAIIANNLASLITTHRTDAESLERAFVIARRLRGLEVPAFQDTYGWIEFRRGNVEEALRHLQPGAAGLPGDPLAQFHLGMAYAAVGGREEEAIAALTRALELGEGRDLLQMATAREQLETLRKTNP